MKIVLIGYRGTGKSTIARLLAARLECSWADADDEIERLAGCSIKEIFAAEGEAGFRDRETKVVQQLMAGSDTVVALGGGAVLREENRQTLQAGLVIWLTATAETIWRRVNDDPATGSRRPNLTTAGGQQEIEDLLRERESIYRACAQHMLDTERKTAEELVDEVVKLLDADRDRTA